MNSKRTDALNVQTPEGITFSLQLAGPVTRFVAWFIDLVVIGFLFMVVNMSLSIIAAVSQDMAMAVSTISFFIISVGYGILAEWYWNGQTVGKKLLRLRVMDIQGLHLQFSQIMIRNLMRFVDSLPATYLVGGTACFVSAKAQRIGDMAANTIVIRNPVVPVPDLALILSDKYNSFRDYPHLAARVRHRVSPAEAAAALQAILRRDRLAAGARIQLFNEIAAHFKERIPFPPEIIHGISDEQYVRNIVDILFNTKAQKASARR